MEFSPTKPTESIDRTPRGDFSQAGLQGLDLREKSLGVVGTVVDSQALVKALAAGNRGTW